MKKKLFFTGLSLLLVAALVLNACSTSTISTTSTKTATLTASTTAPTTSVVPTTSAAPTTSTITTTAAGLPVYGGKLTLLNWQAIQDPSSWDIDMSRTGGSTSTWVTPYLQWYFTGDIDTYGPRGNNQFAFQSSQYIPDQYLTGQLGQSWVFNQNPMSLTITLKQGIMWTGNSKIGMAPREFTSADAVFAGTRQITVAPYASIFTWLKDCVAVDKYTFRWDFNTYYANWEFFLLYGGASAVPFTPESATAGGDDWRNAVGTGPFIFTDYVSGSYATFARNPNYWGKTTINGKQYQLPFIDTLSCPVIADQSTQLAAIRTGKIDFWPYCSENYAATLSQSSPKLVQEPWLTGQVMIFIMNRIDGSPALANKQVRQALFMATDFNTMLKLVYSTGDLLGFPLARGNPSYTPLEKLPASTQALFTYNPTQAKQMLASAGYPSGFNTTITVDATNAIEANAATILVSEWAKIGVTATINSIAPVAVTSTKNARSYQGLVAWVLGVNNPLTPILYVQGTLLGSTYPSSEPLSVQSLAAQAESDPVKRQADIAQLDLAILDDAGFLPMANSYTLNCYWPWLKNYYGEIDAGSANQVPMISRIWIDQNLKKSLGY